MTATRVDRRAALQHLADVLRLAVLGRPRPGVLGYASASGGTGLARWRALPQALARIVRPRPAPELPPLVQWVLTREDGGWAVRPAGISGPPAYYTDAIPAGDQNAAFDWAGDVTPDVERKRISYGGPSPA